MTKNLKGLIAVAVAVGGMAISGCGDSGSGGSGSGNVEPHNCGSQMSWDSYSSMCKAITYSQAPAAEPQKHNSLAQNTACVIYDQNFGACIK